MEFGFTSKLHLKNKAQFDLVFRKGKKISTKNFALFFKLNDLDFPCLGIIVPKRVAAKATDRNRLKRVVRESFRLHQHQINGYDVVFLAYKGLDKVNNEELSKCLAQKWPQKK